MRKDYIWKMLPFLAVFLFFTTNTHAGWSWLDKLGQALTRVTVEEPQIVGGKLVIAATACPSGIKVADGVLESDARKKIAAAYQVERLRAKHRDSTFGEATVDTAKVSKKTAGIEQTCLNVISSRTITKKQQQDESLKKKATQFAEPALKVCYRNIPGLSYSRRGDPQGPAITFATMIAAELGKPVKFVRIAKGSDREKRLGTWCHMAISTYTWTDARAERAAKAKNALSDFYYTGGLVARGLNPEFTTIESMADFSGNIVVIQTTTGAEYAKENFSKANIVEVGRLAQVQGKMASLAKASPDTPVITVHDEILLAGYDGYTPIQVEGLDLLTEADNYVVLIHSSVAYLKEVVDHVISAEGVQDLYYEAAGRQ